jgi:3-oxoacyl-[acyl-carrier-protein] synthase III
VSFLQAFGSYLPSRIVGNEEIGAMTGSSAEWIFNVSGIEERRYAAEGESVADMGAQAAKDCLASAGIEASRIGMLLVASGSSERRFPGPAAGVARRLGLDSAPAIDLPMASAGSLFGMALAGRLAETHGKILVVASEKMSSVILKPPMNAGTSVLFGDGAGACLVSADAGFARIVDSALYTDGAFSEDLKLELDGPLEMNGRTVILQASRKIPKAIGDLLDKHKRAAAEVGCFLMHQANQNLIVRVAEALGVGAEKFYSNIRRYGNTSSASMLIAAAEWQRQSGFAPGKPIVFATFGAGFHWGALLTEGA